MFERIIVGVDGSSVSEDAVAVAARLARDHAGELHLLHAVDWVSLVTGVTASQAITAAQPLMDALQRGGAEALDEAERIAGRFGVRPKRHMVDGSPVRELLIVAHSTGSTLVVVGTHGRQGLSRMMLGSTAEAVLRAATLPVLAVRTAPPVPPERRCISRVLVAVDGSAVADAALEAAYALPPVDRERLFVCCVSDGREESDRHAQAVVGAAIARAEKLELAAKGAVLHDRHPEAAIVKAASRDGADLVIVGTHARDGFERLMLGSVAEAVIRTSPVPTLVIRPATTAAPVESRSEEPARV